MQSYFRSCQGTTGFQDLDAGATIINIFLQTARDRWLLGELVKEGASHGAILGNTLTEGVHNQEIDSDLIGSFPAVLSWWASFIHGPEEAIGMFDCSLKTVVLLVRMLEKI